MIEIKNEVCLQGVYSFKEVIDNVINILNVHNCDFEIKLILSEALNNAYIHGNLRNVNKPIFLRYFYNGKKVKFEVEDSGKGFLSESFKNEISDEKLLDESGRGLFLIYNLSDKLEIRKNVVFIEKDIF